MQTILLLIDFQYIFYLPTAWNVPHFKEAQTNALKAQKKLNNTTTIATRYIPPKPLTGEWVNYFKHYPNISTNPDDKVYDLPIKADFVVSAPKFGKWDAILSSIAMNDVSTVYIAGVATECCVLATALAAVDSGVKVIIISDACAGATQETHDRALNLMKDFAPSITIKTSDSL